MDPEQREFLNLRVKPAVVGYREASWILGFHIDAVIYLAKDGHLAALAKPPRGAQRYFLTSLLLRLAQNLKWVTKAIRLIREYFCRRNQLKK